MASDIQDNVLQSPHKRPSGPSHDPEDNSKRMKVTSDEFLCPKQGDIDFESKFYHKVGLVNSLHGDIYQLKVLMLFLIHALRKSYKFQIGTEVEGAEKFDDIVFKYKVEGEEGAGLSVVRAVQIKHKKQEETYRITVSALSNQDGDYSIPKYFLSYRKMKENPEFKAYQLKDLIIYTNIAFNLDDLEKSSISLNEIEEHDEILKVTKSGKATKRFKFGVPKTNELYEKLRETSDLHVLIKILKSHLNTHKRLNSEIFKNYHYVLTTKVVYIEMPKQPIAKFRREFVTGDNLSEDIKNFRNTLKSSLNIGSNDQFQREMTKMLFYVSKDFAAFELYPTITDTKDLAKKIADIVIQAENNYKHIKICRIKGDVIDSNIDNLSVHILVKDPAKKGLVKFSEMFFDENQQLNGDLDKFRTNLKLNLQEHGIDFLTLSQCKFKIPIFYTCKETLRDTTEANELYKIFIPCFLENNRLPLNTDSLNRYEYLLLKKIFDIEIHDLPIVKFRDDFIAGENLSEDVKNFRNTLQSSLKIEENNQFKRKMSQTKLRASNGFALNIFEPFPIITDPKKLAKKFAEIVIKGRNEPTKVITIRRSKGDIIDSNMSKFAYHILVRDAIENELVRFSAVFLDENRAFNGNLDEFRTHFKSFLQEKGNGIKLLELKQYKFKIQNFHTCEETPEGVPKYPNIELPSDLVQDSEIDEFLAKLVFAVNQPNELELGNIISEKMGDCSQFNLLDASLVSHSFQKNMLDWFKAKRWEKGKEGTWLDATSGQMFMDLIEKKIAGLISVGISIAYPEKLASYCMSLNENEISKKIKAFISKDNASKRILHIVTPEETILSAINVYNTLKVLQQHDEFGYLTKKDSYIFMMLKTLLRENIRKHVVNAFQSPCSYYLFIIDCSGTGPLNDIDIGQFCNNLYKILKESKKKIIFIAGHENSLVNLFAEEVKMKEINHVGFLDLTKESKKIILQKKIVFQGKRVCLHTLINQPDEFLNTLIDIEIINKLLNGEDVYIGKKPKDLGEIKDYYVPRKFRPTVFSKDDILKYLEENGTESEKIVVCGGGSGLKHINAFSYDNVQEAEKKFNELVETHADSNIHWLKSDSKYLLWFKSHGSICNLIPLKIRQRVHNTINLSYLSLIQESELINEDYRHDKIVIISDTAGMGKSTVLTRISIKLKGDSSLWVIRINLNDHTGILDEEIQNKSVGCKTSTVEIIKKILASQDHSELEQKLFINYFENQGRIAFLFDGFDEISPTYKDIITDVLQTLQKSRVANIYVTTRPNVREDLELALGVFSHLLEPFSKDDQIIFLMNYWAKKLQLEKSKDLYENRLKKYVQFTINTISNHINDKEQEFVSIPLQMMMLAEVFLENRNGQPSDWQGCKEYLESESDIPVMPKDFSIVKLYDLFIKRKFYDFYLKDKLGITLTKVGQKELAMREFKLFKKQNEWLALHLLCNKRELKQFLPQTDIKKLTNIIKSFKKGQHNKGIVDEIIDGKPHFIHRTFAEYFASFPVAKKMLSSPFETMVCLNDILLSASPIFMTSLIDQLDGKHETVSLALKKPLLHFVITEMSCSTFVKTMLQVNCETWQKKLDACAKTPLHYATELGLLNIVEQLLIYADDIQEEDILDYGSLANPEYENSILVKFVNLRDNDGRTALDYAIRQCNYDVAFTLLLKGASIDSLADDHVKALIDYMLPEVSRLDVGSKTRYRSIQEKLFLRLPHIFNKLCIDDQSGILSYFFVIGRVRVIEALLSTVSELEKRKRILNNPFYGKTSLDRVLRSVDLSDDERLEVTKWLSEQGSFSMNDHSTIKHILISTAESGQIKTFKYFLSQKLAESFYEIINRASTWNQEIIVTYLYENYRDHISDGRGSTALHSACECDSTEPGPGPKLAIIKYLIENSNVNATNDDGETPLLRAVYKNRRLNLIQYLVSKGANLNCEDIFGNTPLSIAVENDDSDIISYLLNNKACISKKASRLIKDKIIFFTDRDRYNFDLVKDGYPRLHAAVKSSNFDWAKFLVQHGADVNKADIDGNVTLHLCCTMKNSESEIVELLLQHGAIFDMKNNRNKTPRDLLHKSNHCDKVDWLLTVLNKLFNSQQLTQDFNNAILTNNSGSKLHTGGPYGRSNVDPECQNCNPRTESSSLQPHPGIVTSTSINDHVCIHNPIRYILNSRNYQQKTLLHIAADTNDTEAIHTLLKLNNECIEKKKSRVPQYRYFLPILVDSVDSQGNAPIHIAAHKGYTEIVLVLLRYGAIFNSKNYEGNTPEILASINNHSAILELLQSIKKIFCALEDNNLFEIENLIKVTTFPNVRNESGKTPLHLVVSLKNPSRLNTVLNLLWNDADVNAVDSNKNTALHIAAENDSFDIVLHLLQWNKVMYDAINEQGQTPLDLAHGHSYELLRQIESLFRGVKSDTPNIILNIVMDMKSTYGKKATDAFFYMIRDHEGHNLIWNAVKVLKSQDFMRLLNFLK